MAGSANIGVAPSYGADSYNEQFNKLFVGSGQTLREARRDLDAAVAGAGVPAWARRLDRKW
jgi:hypothetical protein